MGNKLPLDKELVWICAIYEDGTCTEGVGYYVADRKEWVVEYSVKPTNQEDIMYWRYLPKEPFLRIKKCKRSKRNAQGILS